MYDFDSALFIYKFIFMSELIIAEVILSILLTKRKHFWLRALLCVLGLYLVAFAIPVVSADAVWVSTMFTIMFLASMAALFICFSDRWTTLLFCGVVAYTTQHISYISGNFISLLCGLSQNTFYATTVISLNLQSVLIDLGFYFVGYLAIFVMVCYFLRATKELRVDNLTLIFVSIVMLTSNIILNAIVVYEDVARLSKTLYTLFFIYDVISCIATVMLLILSINKKTLESENKTLEIENKMLEMENRTLVTLWNMDKENYRIKREKMETISIMCHDIKHRLQRQDGEYSDSKLRELEDVLSKYDTMCNTGNEVIDIILAEENTYCVNHNIQLVSFVDGKALDFMAKEHIYSLFDNFLHNAIEAVETLRDVHKRYIKLNISQMGEMVVINVKNYFDGNTSIEFVDGIPQSTKSGNELHGYGFKSIKAIVDIYNGTMSVNTNEEMFFLDVFFPIPNENER